uniref:phosphoinositide 5-phosphatase n=1 Tax=Kwoniella dejecticola CBS 10117 TaxID=1296121 RepID=A0A1A6AA47_9TREE|nr:phosphatidylinositol phosphate phosphatase [Kwoniella dejecticola CBS 10117]OBR86927.1 phosphatidylinositol phosphate phosphatase [Kwoniella dejecticola CBS 10117]
MPATLYLRPSPRAFFLLTTTHALIFRQPDASESKVSKSVVVAEFLPLEEVDMRGLVKVGRGSGVVQGVLGVTSVPSDRSPIPEIFLLLLSHSTILPSLLPASSASSTPIRPSKILGVDFYSLTSNFWDSPDLLLASQSSRYDEEFDYDDPIPAEPSTAPTSSQAQQAGIENPCGGMKKYLESGSFFYADQVNWDISSRLNEANWVLSPPQRSSPLEEFDQRFIWNSTLLNPFLKFRLGLTEELRNILDEEALLVPIIQGFINSMTISSGFSRTTGKQEIVNLGLISRLSWKRAGARFRTRGIDDDGQVANFVETELVLATEGSIMSYTQVRGSVPLFWEQPSQGLGTLQQKVEITRPPQATQPAFDKHFLELINQYHSVHAVNLLGQRDAESMLSQAYSYHLETLKSTLDTTDEKLDDGTPSKGRLELTPYDFHSAVKIGGHEMVKYDFSMRLNEVMDSMEDFGWTAIDSDNGGVIEKQDGVFRVNCLDCLDRTNYVQDVISSLTLSRFLNSIGSPLQSSQTLWSAHRELWADNGDRLSKIYAGTGALNTSATRSGKKTFAGLLSDATKSVGRAYINNFQDKGKQNAIDMLLGMMAGQRPVILFDPISDSVQAALSARVNEYSRTKVLSIFSGTWNLNGKAPDEALDEWLFPPSDRPDIYMIAFQEIVELTAGQILQTDPAKKRVWEKFIMDTFAMRKGGKSDYLLFRSEQLVGSALIIIVKSELSRHIRNAYELFKQTGLSGLSGNKGGVSIRFQLFDSNVCFVTSHLTAGQSNINERNTDWKTITNGIKFARGRLIEDHEIIIWSADLNYRIALPNAEVRQAIEDGDLDSLLGSDQLLNAMDAGETFIGYDEGPISFKPTYKYDNGTDYYDTSEKQRVPAWTDRILFRGSSLRLKDYNRAELMTSDHRPVYAVFDATIREVDHARKDAITKEIVHSILASGDTNKKMDEKVEDVMRGHGGPKDLVKDLTRMSVTPTLRTSSPRLPPRPTSAASMKENTPVIATTRSHSQSLSTPSNHSASSSLRAINSIQQNARRPAPAIPTSSSTSLSSGRTVTTTAISPNMQPMIPDRRSPIPRTSSRGMIANDTGSSSYTTNSSSITPSSTGDFVFVPSTNASPGSTSNSNSNSSSKQPPPLPPRVGPSPQNTLDVKNPRTTKDGLPRSPSYISSRMRSTSTAAAQDEQTPSLNQLRAKFENPPATLTSASASTRPDRINSIKRKPVPIPIPVPVSTSAPAPAPLPRKSMDINGSPQEGLVSPVKPDPNVPKPAIPVKPRRLSSGVKQVSSVTVPQAKDKSELGLPLATSPENNSVIARSPEKKKPAVPKKPDGLGVGVKAAVKE